ncbi:MAG: hypothetical protein HY815_03155, partial [Candidatus Riflebacteria bacterium]|nr:hypothetical protein [Candidatus Riflebacteria bacterium]
MSSPSTVPWLWTVCIRLAVFVALQGCSARLIGLPDCAGHPTGAQVLLGLTVIAAVVAWPGVACAAAASVLRCPPRDWRFSRGFARSVGSVAATLFYLGAPALALAVWRPALAPWRSALIATRVVVGASFG